MMRLFGRRQARRRTAQSLYGSIVAQARNPDFYLRLSVPDTVDGRFDMIVLHVFLTVRRLRSEAPSGAELGQELVDSFFLALDHAMREAGVGDMAVPKRVRKMAEAYRGRVSAYETACADGMGRELEDALRRNLYPDLECGSSQAVRLADYVKRAARDLEAQNIAALMAGRVSFPEPAAADTE